MPPPARRMYDTRQFPCVFGCTEAGWRRCERARTRRARNVRVPWAADGKASLACACEAALACAELARDSEKSLRLEARSDDFSSSCRPCSESTLPPDAVRCSPRRCCARRCRWPRSGRRDRAVSKTRARAAGLPSACAQTAGRLQTLGALFSLLFLVELSPLSPPCPKRAMATQNFVERPLWCRLLVGATPSGAPSVRSRSFGHLVPGRRRRQRRRPRLRGPGRRWCGYYAPRHATMQRHGWRVIHWRDGEVLIRRTTCRNVVPARARAARHTCVRVGVEASHQEAAAGQRRHMARKQQVPRRITEIGQDKSPMRRSS